MTQILLCGCGKMGQAMLRGWLAKMPTTLNIDAIAVIDPHIGAMADLPAHSNLRYFASAGEVAGDMPSFDIIVLAAKPQNFPAVLEDVMVLASPETAWLSIMAGVSMARISEVLGGSEQIVRAMPNTPAAIGCGVTALATHAGLSAPMRPLAIALMQAVGAVVEVDEGLLDAVTAVSGSGPAYVFLLQEAMEAAAIKMGLDAEVARQLSIATIAGGGALMQATAQNPAELRAHVTSPHGTTAAALEVLLADDALMRLMERAMLAARRRSEELGK